jgi:hypothetical protein
VRLQQWGAVFKLKKGILFAGKLPGEASSNAKEPIK